MVLLLRYTGLRISDVATLSRDRVTPGKILLYTQKTGAHVFLPIGVDLQAALASLPDPRGAGNDPKYYFWNGAMLKQTAVDIAARTLAAVFKIEGPRRACSPDSATRWQRNSWPAVEASRKSQDILGISPPAVVRKHYAKWSHGRQERISTLFEAVYPGTFLAHDKEKAAVTR